MTPDEFMALAKREECSGAMYRACLQFAAQAEADRAELAAMRPVVEAALVARVLPEAVLRAVDAYRAGTPAAKASRFTADEAAELLAVADTVDVHGLKAWAAMVAECKEIR